MLETRHGVVLKPVENRPNMMVKQGLWVHTGKLPPAFDVVQAIRADREERIRKLARPLPHLTLTNLVTIAFRKDRAATATIKPYTWPQSREIFARAR
jgi:hypothetical protein